MRVFSSRQSHRSATGASAIVAPDYGGSSSGINSVAVAQTLVPGTLLAKFLSWCSLRSADRGSTLFTLERYTGFR